MWECVIHDWARFSCYVRTPFAVTAQYSLVCVFRVEWRGKHGLGVREAVRHSLCGVVSLPACIYVYTWYLFSVFVRMQIKKDRMEEQLRLARLSQRLRVQDEGRGRLSHLYKKILTALHRQRKVGTRTSLRLGLRRQSGGYLSYDICHILVNLLTTENEKRIQR